MSRYDLEGLMVVDVEESKSEVWDFLIDSRCAQSLVSSATAL